MHACLLLNLQIFMVTKFEWGNGLKIKGESIKTSPIQILFISKLQEE